MPEPLNLQDEYPDTKDLSRDAYSLRIISPAYASSVGELNTTLQYVYHSFFFEKEGYNEISKTLMRIAVAEMYHFQLLGKTILALGVAPVYTQFPPSNFNFYSAKYVSYSRTLKDMLEDDLLGERHAVSSYSKMLKCLKNQSVIKIIGRILEDEKLHVATLEKILSEFKG